MEVASNAKPIDKRERIAKSLGSIHGHHLIL